MRYDVAQPSTHRHSKLGISNEKHFAEMLMEIEAVTLAGGRGRAATDPAPGAIWSADIRYAQGLRPCFAESRGSQ
jgi:hypothetical protein